MALILTEPFNNFTAAPWTGMTGSETIVAGRTGTAAAVMANINYAMTASGDVTLGFAWKTTNVVTSIFIAELMTSGTVQTSLAYTGAGALQFLKGGSLQLAVSANGLFVANTWYYIEWQCRVAAGTSGFASARVNGTQVFNVTGVDTLVSSIPNTVRLECALGVTHNYDDLYLRNDTTFMGDQVLTTNARNARTSVRVAFATSSIVTAVFASGASVVTFSASATGVVITPPPDLPPAKAHRSEFSFTTTYYPVAEIFMDVQTWDELDARHTTWEAQDIAYGTWDDQTVGWFDVSCYTHEAEIERGRERFTDRFEPGTASVTFKNSSGWADMTGTPDEVFASPLRPARPIRLGIEGPWDLPLWNTPDYVRWLYYGYIDSSRPSYDPVQEDIVTITAIDALGEVGRVKLATLTAAVGAGETVDARISRILVASSCTCPETLHPSATTLLGTTLGSQAVDELGRSADSAGGVVYGDMVGGITYKDRDWMLWATGSPVDATLGFTTGDADEIEACPVDWETSFERADLTTQVEIGRPSELPTIYPDAEGIAMYGPETFSRTDLLCSDTATMFPLLADRWISIRGITSMPRVEAVTLNASNANSSPFITWADVIATYDDWADVLALVPTWGTFPVGTPAQPIEVMTTCMPEKPSRYHCRLETHSGRLVFDRLMFATSVRHAISRDEWTSRITLDAAEWAET